MYNVYVARTTNETKSSNSRLRCPGASRTRTRIGYAYTFSTTTRRTDVTKNNILWCANLMREMRATCEHPMR
jgi:hypothetical protein